VNEEPIEAKEVFHLTFDELLKLSMQEFKKSLGLPSNIVEADPPSTIIDTDIPTSDQPTGLITKNAEEK
jgi:hypothetical protein